MNERYSVGIKELPTNERPRERLQQYGAAFLSTAELLAIVLRTGTHQRSAISLAEHLLSEHRNLRGIANATVQELAKIKGIGPVKAIQVAACVELGKRLAAHNENLQPVIGSPEAAVHLLMPEMRMASKEHFKTLLLDTKNRLIRIATTSIGTLDSSVVHPREVFKDAIGVSAASILVVHNHPSGDPTPSPEDRNVTLRIAEAGKILGIELLDHVIIGDGKWVSMKERGML